MSSRWSRLLYWPRSRPSTAVAWDISRHRSNWIPNGSRFPFWFLPQQHPARLHNPTRSLEHPQGPLLDADGLCSDQEFASLVVCFPWSTTEACLPSVARERKKTLTGQPRAHFTTYNGQPSSAGAKRSKAKSVTNVYAFMRQTVVLQLQNKPKPHEYRSLCQQLCPKAVLDTEGEVSGSTGPARDTCARSDKKTHSPSSASIHLERYK